MRRTRKAAPRRASRAAWAEPTTSTWHPWACRTGGRGGAWASSASTRRIRPAVSQVTRLVVGAPCSVTDSHLGRWGREQTFLFCPLGPPPSSRAWYVHGGAGHPHHGE